MKQHEKEILQKIRAAIYANPFDQSRHAIDLAIAGLSKKDSTEKILAEVLRKVSETIGEIADRGESIASQPNSTDKELLKFGILFHVFHIYSDAYDQHILKQINKGSETCEVVFAREALGLLTDLGIPEKEALRFFALFFQMRRAFYFISGIAGESPSVAALRRSLWNNIFTNDIRIYDQFLWNRMEDFSTLILGETGTGKGMAAAAIGRSGYIPFNAREQRFSESFARTFIQINLSQYPEQLIESELFGHKKGSFTGAIETHDGVFSRCSPCGAIFLDEIGDVSIPIQIKLLQVLQDRTFTSVGSHKAHKFQGRVIAATNKPLGKARQEGQFRDDFYYRLCSDVIEVPSLRQRLREHPGELETILEITLQRILGTQSGELTSEVAAYILDNQPKNYPWPGNIRELEQCVRGILLNNHYIWQDRPDTPDSDPLLSGIETMSLTSHELLAHYCRKLYRKHGTYEAVSQQTRLDRRTVKKYITMVFD